MDVFMLQPLLIDHAPGLDSLVQTDHPELTPVHIIDAQKGIPVQIHNNE